MSFTEDTEENNLRLSEQRYRCLFENSRDAILLHGRIRVCWWKSIDRLKSSPVNLAPY